MDNTTTCPNFPESSTPSADRLTEYLVSNIMKLNRVCDTQKDEIKNAKYNEEDWEKEKSMLHSTINEYKKQLENYPNQVLHTKQISCDCMLGGDCEGETNCANGMRILKLKENIKFSKILLLEKEKEELKENIEELKENIEELKEEKKIYLEGLNLTHEHHKKEIEYCKKEYNEIATTIEKENDELKEENDELKEENEKIGGLVISQTNKLKDVSLKHNELAKKLQSIYQEDGS